MGGSIHPPIFIANFKLFGFGAAHALRHFILQRCEPFDDLAAFDQAMRFSVQLTTLFTVDNARCIRTFDDPAKRLPVSSLDDLARRICLDRFDLHKLII
jgi:hypothetical protein